MMTVRDDNDTTDIKLGDSGPRAGDRLRAARMDLGMSEADVAAALHLDVRTVEALESEDSAKLPPSTFTRGYYRSYARLLGADEDAVLRSYARDHGGDEPPPTLTVPPPVEVSPRLSRGLFSGLLVILLIGGAGGTGYWYYTNHGLPRIGPVSTESDQQDGEEVTPDTASSETPEEAWQAADEEMSGGAELDEPGPAGPPDSTAMRDNPAAEPVPGDPGIDDVPSPDPEDAFTTELAGPEEGQVGDDAEAETSPPTVAGSDEPTESEPPPVADDEPPPEEPVAADSGSEPSVDPVESADAETPDESVTAPDFTSDALAESVDSALAANAGPEPEPLVLNFTGSSWIEVYDDDGERLLYGLIRDTGTQSVEGRPPYTVVVGDADNVDLEYGGEPVDLGQRRPGRVARIQVPR